MKFPLEILIENAHKNAINSLSELYTGELVSCSGSGSIKLWKIKGNSFTLKEVLDNGSEYGVHMCILIDLGNRKEESDNNV